LITKPIYLKLIPVKWNSEKGSKKENETPNPLDASNWQHPKQQG
jgi:hypothetical protein